MHYLPKEPKVHGTDTITMLWESMMQVSQVICKVVNNVTWYRAIQENSHNRNIPWGLQSGWTRGGEHFLK